jgi:hypothetical protein
MEQSYIFLEDLSFYISDLYVNKYYCHSHRIRSCVRNVAVAVYTYDIKIYEVGTVPSGIIFAPDFAKVSQLIEVLKSYTNGMLLS